MYVVPKIDELTKKRQSAGMTMKQLSLRAKLPGNAILRLETKKVAKTNYLRAREIARALGCTVEEVFEPSGELALKG